MFLLQDSDQVQKPEMGLTQEEIQELWSLLQAPMSPNSGGSEVSDPSVLDERKRRRMISNRESARRSRWRKKRHLENLTAQLSQLTVENRKLNAQLGLLLNQCNVAWRENERLKSEALVLRTRLLNFCKILPPMQPQ